MPTNFLQIEPGRDSSNKWRNVLFAIILMAGVGSAWFWYTESSYTSIMPQEGLVAVGDTVDVPVEAHLTLSDVEEGGDVVVEPPEHVTSKFPVLQGELLSADALSARAVIAKDQESGVVLYAKNEYEKHPIASITKLMSALVLLEKSLEWDEIAEVSSDDIVGTHMYAGESYTIEALWRAALVGSSNKAIVTMIDATGWSRDAFIERMNQKALELGMGDTHFEDPTGLDARNVSTASDIVILLNEAMKVNEIRQTLLLKEYNLVSVDYKKRHHMWNTNWLLLGWIDNRLYDLRGGKTGYINASGYNFAMQVGDADGHVISVVAFGTNSHEARFSESRDVAMSVFENYSWPGSRVAGEKIEQ